MHNWYKTNIDFSNALKEDWKPSMMSINNGIRIWKRASNQLFNEDWLENLHSRGLNVVLGAIFYREANFQSTIAHTDLNDDINKLPDMFGLNWTLGGAGSKMVWYEKPEAKIERKLTADNTLYMPYEISKLTELERIEIENDSITLVRVDIPHTIIMGNEPRWCISLRTQYRFQNWEESIEYMKSKNLLIDR